jgi:Xaa-Pro aminopeptidase
MSPSAEVHRIDSLRRQLVPAGCDAILITHLPSIRYLTGFTGSSAVLLVSGTRATLFTDGRYIVQARDEVRGAKVRIVKKGSITAAALQAAAKPAGRHRVGFEAEHLSAASAEELVQSAPSRLEFKPTRQLVEALRMIKDRHEIRLLQNAVNMGSSLMRVLLRELRPGKTEVEVAAALEYAARKAGAEGMSFDSIVAAGRRSAMPHGRASRNPIPAKGFVVLDFGVILAGYHSDMTRTVHLGRASGRERDAYAAVLEAQLAAIATVGPGVEAGQVDEAARKVLRKSGLARYFTHSTGHGVGIEIHEPPRLGQGQKTLLQPGMVITVEPGAYIPGAFGIRIEDMVEVTERGCRVMTPTPKELLEL